MAAPAAAKADSGTLKCRRRWNTANTTAPGRAAAHPAMLMAAGQDGGNRPRRAPAGPPSSSVTAVSTSTKRRNGCW